MMMWGILLALVALALGILLAATTIVVSTSERKPGDPLVDFTFTIVWPSGPRTYRWRWPK